jgi:hypothetical protein
MCAPKYPVTLAIWALRADDVEFEPHLYAWEAHGGTAASAGCAIGERTRRREKR